MKTRLLPVLSVFVVLLMDSLVFAEKAPLTIAELQNQADAIVVAIIKHIRIDEPSHFERTFGNSDWGIFLTLRLETVEKGDVSNQQLEARCFRIKSRRSLIEFFAPSGHHPIPGTGTRVRVYLEKENGSWSVVLPNGITSIENASGLPGGNFQDATEVTQLRSYVFTYFLSMEIWIIIGIPVLIYLWSRRQRKRINKLPRRKQRGITEEKLVPTQQAAGNQTHIRLTQQNKGIQWSNS
jgi:hypothetical protein